MNGKVLAEKNSENVKIYYHFGGRKIMTQDSNGTHYSYYDILNSPVVITDGEGNTENTYKYGPFGNVISAREEFNNNDGYTGHEFDAEIDLHYANARYLDQRIGRWMSKDRASRGLKNPQGLNRWGYVLNNPLIMIDRWGFEGEYIHLVETNMNLEINPDITGYFRPEGGYKEVYDVQTLKMSSPQRNAYLMFCYWDLAGQFADTNMITGSGEVQ